MGKNNNNEVKDSLRANNSSRRRSRHNRNSNAANNNRSNRNKDKDKDSNTSSQDTVAVNVVPQDPFFYAKDQRALEDMANVAFNQVVGDLLFPEQDKDVNLRDTVPYACVMEYDHVINAEDLGSGKGTYVQRAADAFYNYFTQGYTTGVNFESPDVIMAVIAAASLSAVLIEGKRPFGLMHTFMQWNKGYAQKIVNALGIDYQDLKSHLSEFRAQYNLRVATFNQTIAIPKSFMLLLQWGLIAGNVFTDTTSPEFSSLYFFKLRKALKYNPTKLTTGSSLTWFQIGSGSQPLSVDAWFSKIDELFATFNDSDVREMFGAIRRVYSADQLLTLSEITKDYSTPVMHHDTVSTQFHNASWVDREVVGAYPKNILTTGENDVRDVALYQLSDGTIHSKILMQHSPSSTGLSSFLNPAGLNNILMDMYDHLQNAGANIDVTAYMNFPLKKEEDPIFLPTQPDGMDYYTPIYRSTINISCYLVTDTDTRIDVPKAIRLNEVYDAQLDDIANLFRFMTILSHLDSHPIIFVTHHSDAGYDTISGALGEIDKYTLISSVYLNNLNQQSMFQLLSMPANSKSTTK